MPHEKRRTVIWLSFHQLSEIFYSSILNRLPHLGQIISSLFLGVKSSPTSTFRASQSFSSVSSEGLSLPVARPLIDGWVTPIFSASVFRVIPLSLQSSLILNCNILQYFNYRCKGIKNNVIQKEN